MPPQPPASSARIGLLIVIAAAHVLVGALVAFLSYEPHGERDLSFILQEVREGRVREATFNEDECRLYVTTEDGRQWYASYGTSELDQTMLMEELGKSDPLGQVEVTTIGSSWG